MWSNYLSTRIVKLLANYTVYTLSYKGGRYDKQLLSILEFCETQILPEIFKTTPLWEVDSVNLSICKDRRTDVTTVNAEHLIEFKKHYACLVIIMEACYGETHCNLHSVRDLLCCVVYTITAIDRKFITLSHGKFSAKLTRSEFSMKVPDYNQKLGGDKTKYRFDYGFAETIKRFQGAEIDRPYNIRGTQRMHFEELYTALSRVKTPADGTPCIDLIGINYTC